MRKMRRYKPNERWSEARLVFGLCSDWLLDKQHELLFSVLKKFNQQKAITVDEMTELLEGYLRDNSEELGIMYQTRYEIDWGEWLNLSPRASGLFAAEE